MLQYFKQFLFALVASTVLIACGDGDASGDEYVNPNPPPPSLLFNVVNVLPHDTASFTQGLLVHEGKLYESTGMPGTSWLGPVDMKTGKIDRKVNLSNDLFGEGITIMNDKLYHLTWTTKKGFIYNAKDFTKIGEFKYLTEGWGLTNDGTNLIMSDGSSNLYFLKPDTMNVVKTITVTDNVGPVPNLNELEYIDGYIYANQWLTAYILKIDPATGSVVGRLDFNKIQGDVQSADPGIDISENALNGIAYDSASKKIYITGKRWPHLYEITFQ